MKFTSSLFVLAALATSFLPNESVQAQTTSNPAPTATLNSTLPFQLRGGFLITVEGRIGLLSGLHFFLDTGATQTVIAFRIAAQLSLPLHKAKVLNFDRSIKVGSANLTDLQLGSLTISNLPVLVGDLAQLSEFASGIDAIIGLDVLRSTQSLLINYRSNTLTLRTTANTFIAPRTSPQALVLSLPVQGQHVRLILDTGLRGMLLYSDRLRTNIPQLKLIDKISNAHEGRLSGEQATLPGINLGSEELQASVILLSGAPYSFPSDIEGYVGPSLLLAQLLELNFASNSLRWE
jgi:gag-polyprotein putative aspartyl protease